MSALIQNQAPLIDRLKAVDKKLNTQSLFLVKEALTELRGLRKQYPNPEVQCRLAEACFKVTLATQGAAAQRNHIGEGIVACEAVLKANLNQPDAHKWMAMLLGQRSGLQPILQKVKDAAAFKRHLDIAFVLRPYDALLNYMKGRFCMEACEMTWYEARVARFIFHEYPRGTYEEALEYFAKAEQYGMREKKDLKLYMAKCLIALDQHDDAVRCLLEADECENSLLEVVNEEVKSLLQREHVRKKR